MFYAYNTKRARRDTRQKTEYHNFMIPKLITMFIKTAEQRKFQVKNCIKRTVNRQSYL